MKNIYVSFLVILSLLLGLFEGMAAPQSAGAAHWTLSNPVIEKDLSDVQTVTWDCVWFGSYPQSEVVSSRDDFNALLSYDDSQLIEDEALYEKLQDDARWDAQGVCFIDGEKYKRITEDDTMIEYSTRQMYHWYDTGYHYFKYEPVKWRVLSVEGDSLFLLADIAVDSGTYNTTGDEENYSGWKDSSIRTWMNETFYQEAFDDSEQKAIQETYLKNLDNCLEDEADQEATRDKIFLLSGEDVSGSSHLSYGLSSETSDWDDGRKSKSSMYAKAQGCYSRTSYDALQNCDWWLRSTGYSWEWDGASDTDSESLEDNYSWAEYVDGYGYYYNYQEGQGTQYLAAIRPALYLDGSALETYQYAGTVSSDRYTEAYVVTQAGISTNITYANPTTYTADSGKQFVSWDTLTFGEYPQTEVIPQDFNYTETYGYDFSEDCFLRSDEIYKELNGITEWDENDDVVLAGTKYHREQSYRSAGKMEYHYFRYEPIRWLILQVEGTKALLLAEQWLDTQPYHLSTRKITWQKSTLRSWLNSYDSSTNVEQQDYETSGFLTKAFTEEEQAAICETDLSNKDTSANESQSEDSVDTADRIFCLSEEELTGEKGKLYGLEGTEDASFRTASGTAFSVRRGLYGDSLSYAAFLGEDMSGSYWTRCSDLDTSCASIVQTNGAIDIREVSNSETGVRPALYLDLSQMDVYEYSGTYVRSQDEKVTKVSSISVSTTTESPTEPTAELPTESPTELPAESEVTESVMENSIENSMESSLVAPNGLSPVQGIKLSLKADGNVKISWKTDSEADGYAILRSLHKKNGFQKISLQKRKKNKSMSYTDASVKKGKTYYYQIIPFVSGYAKGASFSGAVTKKISTYWYTAPKVIISKHTSSSGQRYVEITLKKYQGKYAQIQMKKGKTYVNLSIKKKTIRGYQGKYRLRYYATGKTVKFRIRTYGVRNEKKRYSPYCKDISLTL